MTKHTPSAAQRPKFPCASDQLVLTRLALSGCCVQIETGEVLQSFTHTLPLKQKVAFIEQFNEKLLVKQKNAPLQMIDVAERWSCTEFSESQFPTPAAFIFLYENALFLTFTKRQIATWNFKGQKIAQFEDHDNWSEERRNKRTQRGGRA